MSPTDAVPAAELGDRESKSIGQGNLPSTGRRLHQHGARWAPALAPRCGQRHRPWPARSHAVAVQNETAHRWRPCGLASSIQVQSCERNRHGPAPNAITKESSSASPKAPVVTSAQVLSLITLRCIDVKGRTLFPNRRSARTTPSASSHSASRGLATRLHTWRTWAYVTDLTE